MFPYGENCNLWFVIVRYVGESIKTAIQDAASPNDSGYGSPHKDEVQVSPVLVTELERGYEELYLCKTGSLTATYKDGVQPPLRNSPTKYLAAINSSPGWNRSISQQLARIEARRGVDKRPPVNVNLFEENED